MSTFSQTSFMTAEDLRDLTGYEDQFLTHAASNAVSLRRQVYNYAHLPSQVHLLTGPSGSGKTSLSLMLKMWDRVHAIDLDEYGYHPADRPNDWVIDIRALIHRIKLLNKQQLLPTFVIGAASNIYFVSSELRREFNATVDIIVPPYDIWAKANDDKDHESDHRYPMIYDPSGYVRMIQEMAAKFPAALMLLADLESDRPWPTAPWVEEAFIYPKGDSLVNFWEWLYSALSRNFGLTTDGHAPDTLRYALYWHKPAKLIVSTPPQEIHERNLKSHVSQS